MLDIMASRYAREDQTMRVLIAEDDAISRRVLQATLQKWGYQVEVAIDGQQAWNTLQRDDAPQLVIWDWMMPEIDGAEVCRRIKAREDKPYI
jgi:CheY-like chemotaxis protein